MPKIIRAALWAATFITLTSPIISLATRSLNGQDASAANHTTAAKKQRRTAAEKPFHGNAGEFVPGEPAKSDGCAIDGALPDPDCTPGAVMGITKEEICTTSTRGRRHVSAQTKKQVYAAYGITGPQPSGTYEVDHFIPLELGGSNDVANLWPEPASPVPGFHEKDKVETYLHNQVCKQGMDLAEAQRTIATDWLSYYRDQMAGK